MNFLKKHSTKIAFFAVNGLLITTGAIAINNQQKEKNNKIATEALSVDNADIAEAPTASIDSNEIAKPTEAPTPTSAGVATSSSTKSTTKSTIVPSATTVKTTTKPKTTPTVKATTNSTTAPTPKSVATTAPTPVPTPAPAVKTKTS